MSRQVEEPNWNEWWPGTRTLVKYQGDPGYWHGRLFPQSALDEGGRFVYTPDGDLSYEDLDYWCEGVEKPAAAMEIPDRAPKKGGDVFSLRGPKQRLEMDRPMKAPPKGPRVQCRWCAELATTCCSRCFCRLCAGCSYGSLCPTCCFVGDGTKELGGKSQTKEDAGYSTRRGSGEQYKDTLTTPPNMRRLGHAHGQGQALGEPH